MSQPDADFWENFLDALEERRVVPIVGRGMLRIETPEGPKPYYHLVAERLAVELGVDVGKLPGGYDTNDVVCASVGFKGDADEINPKVVKVLKGLSVPTPEALRLLVEIPAFQLFLSTTIDTLLEEAVRAVRGRAPAAIAFPPTKGVIDFSDELIEMNGAVVFQLLGRASASARFAVTEGQMLEHMHDLMASPGRPEKLINRLCESHLLILGVGFPDWLARFLLRMARAKPLWDSRMIMEVIADDGRPGDELSSFLQYFSPKKSHLFTDASPVEFVREMNRRWFERHPRNQAPVADSTVSVKPDDMTGGSVFVSYASEDRVAAFRMADRLAAAGVEVWVDRRLNPGDEYTPIIERYIKKCCAFVALISRHTQARGRSWFRQEWQLASSLTRGDFGTGRAFLFPVVVDDTEVASVGMDEINDQCRELFGRTAALAPEGAPAAEFIDKLNEVQKTWRKEQKRG
jgi:hypothetical protein